MNLRYNKSAKSSTLHIDTKDQALRLASDLLRVALHDGHSPELHSPYSRRAQRFRESNSTRMFLFSPVSAASRSNCRARWDSPASS
jgi:hypothetical protein